MGCCCCKRVDQPDFSVKLDVAIPKEMVAVHDFKATHDHDLTISKGDILTVTEEPKGNWIKARNSDGLQGFVPINHLAVEGSLESKDWFFGTMSRWEAENLLLNNDVEQPIGTFLIRLSNNVRDGYILSVKCLSEWTTIVKHYIIVPDSQNCGYCFENNTPFFPSLDALMTYLLSTNACLSDSREKCSTYLTEPCVKPPPPLYEFTSQTDDSWEIPREDLVLHSLLGKGNFGQVFYALWESSREVAVKCLKDAGPQYVKAFLEEASIMKQLCHPKLVRLYGVCTSVGGPLLLVQEYMSKGDLLRLLRHDQGRTLNLTALFSIANQVAEGMEFLASMNYIHRDLAARNVLISENNVAKIGDFGLSRLLDSPAYISAKSKTAYKWTEPLAIQTGMFTLESDVWSYGILLMELFSYGVSPYSEVSDTSFLIARLLAGYRMKKPPRVPDDIYDLARSCWAENPKRRPSFTKLRQMFSSNNPDQLPSLIVTNQGSVYDNFTLPKSTQ